MRKKVYAAWILAIIMVMSGVLCTQAETVSTGKAHGSKVNTTGETTPTEAEKQFEEAEQIHVTVRYSSDWEYSDYSYSSDYGSYVELSMHAVTRRFEHRGHDREELFQIGCIGLMKAIDKFDVSLQLAFSTYAVPMITGEIRRFLRDDGMIKVSRTLKENGYKIRRAGEMLTRELGREPTMEELAEAAGLEREEIVLALEANREVASIYQPVYERDGEELLLIDQMEGSGGQSAEREEPEKEAVQTTFWWNSCWRPSASVSAVCCNSDTTRERHSARWQNCCR